MDRILSGATTPDQSKPGSEGNKGVFCIPLSSRITGALPLEYLVSYPGHSLEESYPSAEMQSEYSAAWANRAIFWLLHWCFDTSNHNR